jgi:hypothetical protein
MRLRAACVATGGNYGEGRLGLLIMALFYVAARRLEHLRNLGGDPRVARFCGLARIPTARTLGNWLHQLRQTPLAPLVQLNHDLVADAVKRLALPRLTIDGVGQSAELYARFEVGRSRHNRSVMPVVMPATACDRPKTAPPEPTRERKPLGK